MTYHVTHKGRELTVEADFEPPTKGYRNSFGVPEEPDDPGGFVIEDVRDDDGPVDADPDEIEALLWEQLHEPVDCEEDC